MRYGLLSLSILLTAGLSLAEFFWRFPASAFSVLKGMGGVRVYATAVEVNGHDGSLESYSFTGTTAPALARRLARQLGITAPVSPGAAHLAATRNGKTSHFFILPAPGGEDQCAVLAFEQEAAPGAKAPAWPDGVPALAAEPTFSAVCKKTRTVLVQARSPQSPEALLGEAADQLKRQGWMEVSPESSVCRLFTYGHKHCILLGDRKENAMDSTLTLLQREGTEK